MCNYVTSWGASCCTTTHRNGKAQTDSNFGWGFGDSWGYFTVGILIFITERKPNVTLQNNSNGWGFLIPVSCTLRVTRTSISHPHHEIRSTWQIYSLFTRGVGDSSVSNFLSLTPSTRKSQSITNDVVAIWTHFIRAIRPNFWLAGNSTAYTVNP